MSHNASDRKWIRTNIRMNGQSIGRHIIRCSEPGCTNEHEIIDRNARQLPFNEVEKRFTRDKWFVGRNDKHDVCPECIKKRQDERRSRRIHSKPAEPVSNIVPIQQVIQETPMTTTMPDRPINREDKRLINIKLHEVYMGEKDGYYAPHTDHSVAKDLGVPVAWVRDLREEMFGPAHSNSDIDDQLAKIEAIKADAAKLADDANAMLNEIRAIVVKLPPLSQRMNDIQRTIEALARTSETIRKAVS